MVNEYNTFRYGNKMAEIIDESRKVGYYEASLRTVDRVCNDLIKSVENGYVDIDDIKKYGNNLRASIIKEFTDGGFYNENFISNHIKGKHSSDWNEKIYLLRKEQIDNEINIK